MNRRNRGLAAVAAVSTALAAYHVAESVAIDYVPAYLSRPPRLYVEAEPLVVLPPLPSLPSFGYEAVLTALLIWLLGVAYGVFLFERHNPGETRRRLSAALRGRLWR